MPITRWNRRPVTQMALSAGLLVLCLGCGKQEPAPQPAAPAAAPTGTVKIEFDMPVDPGAVVTISSSQYSPKDLEQELKLPPGEHSISVKQPGLTLGPQPFQVAANERRIVRVYDPNRRAAEWALGLGARVDVIVEGKDRQFTSLAQLPASSVKVVTISLEDKPIRDDDLTNLKNLTGLKSLFLSRTGITGAAFAHLRGLPALAELRVEGTQVTDDSLTELHSLPALATFRAYATSIGDEGAAHLRDLKLTTLALGKSRLTDRGLESLAQISSLISLDVNQLPVTDLGLSHVARLPNLRSLNLDNTQVTDAGLSELKSLPKLTVLFVAGTRLTDQGLEQLCQSKRWTYLRLINTQVTDAGLAHLSGLDKLTTLQLYNTKITAAGLPQLKTLKSLQSLSVPRSPEFDAAIADLKQVLPNLKLDR
jgi:hypothetical protein